MAANPYAYGALKPLHNKALVEILEDGEYPTPQAMANMLAKKLDELRSEDVQYMTVREHGLGEAYWGTGPYRTFAEAQKAIEKSRAGLAGFGKVAIVPTIHPDRVERSADRADEFPERHKGHWALYQEVAR